MASFLGCESLPLQFVPTLPFLCGFMIVLCEIRRGCCGHCGSRRQCCQLHQIHEVKQEVDQDVVDFDAAFEESERLINEWKVTDVAQTYSANGGGRHELFNKKITALRKFRDNAAHDLRTNRLSETRGMSGKRKGNILLRLVHQRGEAIFTDSPFLGA